MTRRIEYRTPKLDEAIDRIVVVAPRISSEPLGAARHSPEASAIPVQCFSNAQLKAQQSGGTVCYGWMFQVRPGHLIAVNHVVWHAPDDRLVDVTPFHSDPKHRPIIVNDGASVLFLPDHCAAPLRNEQVGLTLPSWFKVAAAHVAELASKELVWWEKQVAATEGLKDCQRAADLLRLRRGLPPS